MQILTSTGRLVEKGQLNLKAGVNKFDLIPRKYEKGVYYIKVLLKEEALTTNWVIMSVD